MTAPIIRACDYPKCPSGALAVYGHFLCFEHGEGACKFVLPIETDWAGKCAAVGNWIESKRPQVRKMALGGA